MCDTCCFDLVVISSTNTQTGDVKKVDMWIWAAVGGGVLLLLVILITIVVVCRKRRKNAVPVATEYVLCIYVCLWYVSVFMCI